jgi:polysaccharide biosynthesis protein PslH
MKVLLISRCPPYPLYLGDRLILYHLARELAARGHQLDLLALYDRDDDAAPAARAPYAAFFRHIDLIREQPRTPAALLRRLLLPAARFPHSAATAWSPQLWRAIAARLSAAQYDVAHLFGGVQVYEYAHLLRQTPTLITPYESYSLYLSRAIAASSSPLGNLSLQFQRAVARRYEAFMFTPYERVVVVSDADHDELRALNPALPLEVIPNGIDLDYFAPQSIQRDPNMLLFTGNFEYAPNVDAALLLARDILPLVRARLPQVRLHLVGNAPPPALIALGSDHIVVTGRVDDVRPYLAQAALYVCPLRFGAGIKNKVLEALAMGCAVIATPLSIDGIDARDGDHLLLADADAPTFAARIIAALDDAPLRQRLGDDGRALIAARYTWAQVAARYEQIYGEMQA